MCGGVEWKDQSEGFSDSGLVATFNVQLQIYVTFPRRNVRAKMYLLQQLLIGLGQLVSTFNVCSLHNRNLSEMDSSL